MKWQRDGGWGRNDSNRHVSYSPKRNTKEMAKEFGLESAQHLAGIMTWSKASPPKPVLKVQGGHNASWFDAIEMREWWERHNALKMAGPWGDAYRRALHCGHAPGIAAAIAGDAEKAAKQKARRSSK